MKDPIGLSPASCRETQPAQLAATSHLGNGRAPSPPQFWQCKEGSWWRPEAPSLLSQNVLLFLLRVWMTASTLICTSLWLFWVEHFLSQNWWIRDLLFLVLSLLCIMPLWSYLWPSDRLITMKKVTKPSAIQLGIGMPGWHLRKWKRDFVETFPINSCCQLVLEFLWILLESVI